MIKKNKLLTAFKAISIFSLLATIISYTIAVEIAGSSSISLLLYVLLLLLALPFCGYFILRKFISFKDDFLLLICSSPLGIAVLFLSYIILQPLDINILCAIPSIVFGFLGAYEFFKKTKLLLLTLNVQRCILILSFCVFMLFYLFMGIFSFAKVSQIGAFSYHQDMFFSVGNAASVYNGFPFEDMRLAGTSLNYHFLNDVSAGLLGYSLSIPAYDALCFFYYPVIACLFFCSIYKFCTLLCKNRILCAFAPAILYFVNFSNSMLLYDYFVNMNGQGSSTFIALSFAILFFAIYKQQKISIINILLIFIYAIVLTLFKSTVAGIVFAALMCAGFVHFIIHKKNYTAIFYSAIALLGFFAVYITVLSKATNNLVFVGIGVLPSSLKAAFISTPLIVLIFAICGFHALINIKKQSFLNLFCYATAFGGILAFCLYVHYSASQNYFYFIAVPFAIFAVLPSVLSFCTKRKAACALIISSCVICAFFSIDTLALYSSNGVRALLNIYGIVSDPYDESYITAYDEQAMVWLRDNSLQDAVFATNRNNRYKASGDGIFHYYTAVSQRRAFIESYRYTMDYSAMYEEVRRRLENVSDEIFYNLSEEDAFELAKKEGINYLVVKKTISNPEFKNNIVYENEEIVIHKIE